MVPGAAAHLPPLPQLGRLALHPFPVLDVGAFCYNKHFKNCVAFGLGWGGQGLYLREPLEARAGQESVLCFFFWRGVPQDPESVFGLGWGVRVRGRWGCALDWNPGLCVPPWEMPR